MIWLAPARIGLLILVIAAAGCQDKRADRAYLRGDYDTAVHELQALADRGEARAQYDLALLYDKGLGVSQNDAQALYWYQRAAEQEDPRAQYNLALMYLNGQGTAPNYIRAYYWLSMALIQGDLLAQGARDYLIEKMEPNQIKEAERLVNNRVMTGQMPVFHNSPREGS